MPRMHRLRRWAPPVAIALLAGCAVTPVYGPDSPATVIAVPSRPLARAPLAPRLPLTVGLVLPAALRDQVVVSGGGNTPRVRYQIGAELVETLEAMFLALFDRVVVVEAEPAASRDPSVDLVATVDAGSTPAMAWVEVDFRAPQGEAIAAVMRASPRLPDSAIRSASIGHGAGGPAGLSTIDWTNSRLTTFRPAEELQSEARIAMEDLAGDVAVAVVTSDSLARWAAERRARWAWPAVSGEQDRQTAPATGIAIVACIENGASCAPNADTRALEAELRKIDPTLQFADAGVAAAVGFPWIRGSDVDAWPPEAVLREGSFAAAFASAGVRRLVIWKGLTTSSADNFPALATGMGVMGAGYFAKRDQARAVVIDLAPSAPPIRAIDFDELRMTSAGAMIGFIPLIVPLPGLGSSSHGTFARQILPLLRD